MKRRVYDFDKTIYDGDATADFYRRCFLKYPRVALDLLVACWYFAAMALGFLEKTRAKQRFYRFLRFVPDVAAEVTGFWVDNAHKIKSWYRSCRRDDDLIISASPAFLLSPICQELHVSLLASRVDPHTGRTQGLNCHGPEKVRRMEEAYPGTEVEAFYSDSMSDAPLAAIAERAFLVRGDRLTPWPAERKAPVKKIRVSSELAYAVGILMLSFAVAVMSAASFGMSMVVAPAYILSEKLTMLTFGQCEYILQAFVFLLFCLIMRRVRLVYFLSFATCLIYGAVLDLWRWLVPFLNPAVTPPGSFSTVVRLALFAAGMLMTSFSIALFFKSYLPPQVYELFVKFISRKYGIDRTLFKRLYDAGSLVLGTAMTLLFFGRFTGIGWGTLIMAAFNGLLIGFWDRAMNRFLDFQPRFPKFARFFAET